MQINVNISKALGWKITWLRLWLLFPVSIENIHSWSGSCWKTPTPAGVDFCTPAPAHLWYLQHVMKLFQKTLSCVQKYFF